MPTHQRKDDSDEMYAAVSDSEHNHSQYHDVGDSKAIEELRGQRVEFKEKGERSLWEVGS